MANYTIIGGDGKSYGPVADYELHQWIRDGRLNADTRVQVVGEKEWKGLGDLPEFSATFHAPKPPPLSAAAATPARTSGMAIASLVLGVLGLFTCGITALVGVVLGAIAMVKIRNSDNRVEGHGIALAGVIVSGVFLLLIPFCAAVMLPAFAQAKQKAQAIVCLNNEKQLSIALRIYTADHDNHLPPAATWCDAIKANVHSDRTFKCVAAHRTGRCDYAFNAKLDGMDLSKVDPRTVLIFESDGIWNANGGQEVLLRKPRHSRMITVGLADGSVQQLSPTRLGTLRWDP